MGRPSATLLTLAVAAVAAVALTSCGGSSAKLLPGRTASEIETNLDSVARLAAEHECIGAANTAQAVSSQVEALGGVDGKLKEALEEGAKRLNEVVARCEETQTTEETTEPLETEEAPETTKKHEKSEPSEKAEKEQEKAEEKSEEEAEGNPSLPPQSNGKGKGSENGKGPGTTPEAGQPSGGVSPSVPAGGE